MSSPAQPIPEAAPAPQAEAQKPHMEAVTPQTPEAAPEIKKTTQETAEKIHAATTAEAAEEPHEQKDTAPHVEVPKEPHPPELHETPHTTTPAGENPLKKLWGWAKTKAKEWWSIFWTGKKSDGSAPPAPHH